MGKGETEEVRGRKSEARGIDKNARATQVRVKGLFRAESESSTKLLPPCHLFFLPTHSLDSLMNDSINLSLSSSRVVRLNTRGRTLLELVQRSSEPQLIRGRAPGS